MASREIKDGVQDGRQIKSKVICNIGNIGNTNQIYTSFCALSNAKRIISSTKSIFDEILSKFWLFLKNNSGSLGGQIPRPLVGRLNSDHNLESNY